MQAVKTNFQDATIAESEHAKALASAAHKLKQTTSASLKNFSAGRSDLYKVNPYLLTIEQGWNSRDMRAPGNQAHIDELAQSIAVHGVLTPIQICPRNEALVVIDGHSRLLATFRAIDVYGATIETVPVQMEGKGSNDADRLLKQVIGNSGKRLAPIEEGLVYKRLLGFGWSIEKIAQQAARSATHVNNLIDLQGAPGKLKDMIIKGEVSATLVTSQIAENKGDKIAVTKRLSEAVEVAKQNGKAKVTAKDLREDTKKSEKQEKLTKNEQTVKIVLEAAKIDNSDPDYIDIRLTYDQFDIMKQALKLNL
ncbi:unnamed protein product [Sphagnum tenellum]